MRTMVLSFLLGIMFASGTAYAASQANTWLSQR